MSKKNKKEKNKEPEKNQEQSESVISFERQKIIELEKQLKEAKDKYLHLLAESENTRKRLNKENSDSIKFAMENTICEFLPVLDNFEIALSHSKNSSEEVKNWATGFQMILSQFRDVLHNHDIVAFHSQGNHFDPHYHDAMEIVDTNDHPDGMIIDEFAKGYKSPQRIIRPAKVKVAKCTEESKKQDTNIEEQKN
jgi:molecular chaperone GrpE